MTPITWENPLWLGAAALAAGGLLWAWRRRDLRQRAALGTFAAPHLHLQLTASISAVKRFWKRAFFLGAVVALFAALARPQAGFRWEETKRRGIEVLFAVDTSRSMLTPDVKPNRLERAKLAVDDFVARMDGDGVGLVAFAGTAFLQCPITSDYGAFADSLAALDTGVIPIGGTNIAGAIEEAQAALRDRPATDRILILLTDGEDLSGDALAAAKAAAKDGLKICTVGVGTAQGELIPLPADQGGGYVRNEAGEFVKSRLDEARLREIALATGGVYAPLGSEGQGLDAIYRQALAPLARRDLASRRHQVPIERYQWPLGAALLLLMGGTLIGSRRRVRRPGRALAHESRPGLPLIARRAVLPALVFLLVPLARIQASPATAEKAYRDGNFAAAQQEYLAAAQRAPQQPLLEFNAGAAAYRAGNYSAAASALSKSVALQPSADPGRIAAQEDAYYDLGNTLYRTGQKSVAANPQQTIQAWAEAVKNYDSALQLRPGDADASYNRTLVQQRLDALKQQQQQKQQQQNQNGQNQPKTDQTRQAGSPSQPAPPQDNRSGAKRGQGNQPAAANGQPAAGKPSPKAGTAPHPSSTPPAAASPARDQEHRGSPNAAQAKSTQGSPSQAHQPNPAPPIAQAAGQPGAGANQSDRPADDAPEPPGQMSKADARALLDSVKDETRRLPGSPVARSGEANVSPTQILKDW